MGEQDRINVKAELVSFKGEDCLKFTFTGHFTEKDAEYGVGEWKELFASAENQKVTLIWDSTQMTGFDNKARIIWQHALKDMKKQIKCVWLISNSKIIRTGAKVMSAFTSFCLKVVDNSDKIVFSVLL